MHYLWLESSGAVCVDWACFAGVCNVINAVIVIQDAERRQASSLNARSNFNNLSVKRNYWQVTDNDMVRTIRRLLLLDMRLSTVHSDGDNQTSLLASLALLSFGVRLVNRPYGLHFKVTNGSMGLSVCGFPTAGRGHVSFPCMHMLHSTCFQQCFWKVLVSCKTSQYSWIIVMWHFSWNPKAVVDCICNLLTYCLPWVVCGSMNFSSLCCPRLFG